MKMKMGMKLKLALALALVEGVWEMAKDAVLQKVVAACSATRRLPLPRLDGVSCVVTGATSGIGLHTAHQLAMSGAHLVMACRNTAAAHEIVRSWQRHLDMDMDAAAAASSTLDVHVMELELSCLASVHTFAATLTAKRHSLDILVNNAGIYRMGEAQKFTKDGNEQHMQVNHLGPALLTLLLLPLLRRSPRPRIVNVNSVAHHCAVVDPNDLNLKSSKNKYACISAYGASKLAHLMFLWMLSTKLPPESQIDIVAVHPGIVSTNLIGFVESHYKDKSFWRFQPAQGAKSVLYCATSAKICTESKDTKEGSRFAYYRYDCRPVRVCRRAMDAQKAQLVWNKTVELLGLHNDIAHHLL